MAAKPQQLTRTRVFRLRAYTPPPQEALWRTMFFFNLYRLTLAVLLIFLFGAPGSTFLQDSRNTSLFYDVSVFYGVMALLAQVAIRLRKPSFPVQLAIQVGVDIVCIAVLSYAAGGAKGLGVLLLISLAAAGMISRGKITLFFAATASVAMLLEHTYAVLTDEADTTQFFQAGLLSIAYFAVAWSAHTLAKYAVASEKLASERGVALASMAEANRLVIQGLPDGVLMVDEQGTIKQYNPSAERLLGCDFAASGNLSLGTCAPMLAEMFETWRRDRGRQASGVRLPNSRRMVRIRFLPVQEQFGGALLILEDLQRVQAQAQQIKLAALGRLTANIAHEIRNPLSAISYAVELFREEAAVDATQKQLANIIMENTARLNRIVQDVMQLNRRDRVQSEKLHLDEELRKFSREFCQAEHVAPELLEVEAPECDVTFDRGHLNQVLWNLCGNALRHGSKQPGSVKLHAVLSTDGRVSLEIADDGPGVAIEVEQQLFEPFFTTVSSGTGLGLYVARELCEANSALLEYIRRSEGGACFRIVFGGGG